MTKIKIGDTLDVEQAWEDEAGQYHDETAEVLALNDDGTMKLKFIGVSEEVQKYLDDCTFEAKDYEDYIL